MSVGSGGIILASHVNLAGLKLIRRGNRTGSSASGLTSETGWLRVDGIPMTAGRAYLLAAINFGITLSSTTSAAVGRLRLATSGSASTSSTERGITRLRNGSAGDSPIMAVFGFYAPTSDHAGASVLLSGARGSGSDTFTMGAGGQGTELLIFDAGEDPGDSGVDV